MSKLVLDIHSVCSDLAVLIPQVCSIFSNVPRSQVRQKALMRARIVRPPGHLIARPAEDGAVHHSRPGRMECT